MKNLKAFIFGLLLFYYSASALAVDVVGNVPLDRNANAAFIPTNVRQVPELFISRDQYLISYNRKHRLLNWAAWKIEESDLGHVGRTNSFEADADLETYLNRFSEHAVTPQDYQGTCFDRGHQVPSADRDDSVENNHMTFMMSNMIPQTAYLNRVIWEHFEGYIRDLVNTQGKKIYVVAGPLFDQDFGTIGEKQDIPVPSKDFKIIFILNKNQTAADINSSTENIAVIMPNILKSGKKPFEDREELCSNKNLSTANDVTAPSTMDWIQYKTTIAEVERLSGFKMLSVRNQLRTPRNPKNPISN
jgi:endonuclease G